ncbi:MAG: hemolysin III family protein [Xanthomonadales bacterium]|nr:hemolysin III family protein [Xanthomonadales bacterium]
MYRGERLNSITHLVGTVLALMGLGALLAVAVGTRDPWTIASFAVFGVSMVLLYTMSTLYHSFRPPKLKGLFRLFDHISIYLLIAGTYTPFMLVSMRHYGGWPIMISIWSLAALGILLELLPWRTPKVVQLVIYLGMGWACAVDFATLKATLPAAGVAWLTIGGVSYTLGVLFYLLDKLDRLRHAHGIWHFFVLAGTVSHFISVIGFVRPPG